MDYMSINNKLFSEYVDLINNIKVLPDHAIIQLLQNYTQLDSREDIQYLQISKVNMSNKDLQIVHHTLVILSEIDSAINECISSMNIKTLKALINKIDDFYKIS